MSYNRKYKDLLLEILENGEFQNNRTGITALTIPSAYFTHNMNEGFPLLGLRKMPYNSVKVELEGFIKGISSKKWYQERGCKFWNEWCNPQKVKYSNNLESKEKMLKEDDLGIIYGNNWRDFHCPTSRSSGGFTEDSNVGDGIDQLQSIIKTLKTNPQDRRMVCLSWNPLALDFAALPACHVLWRVVELNGKLHLSWYQRSTDYILGFPSNMASYATLLHLLCKESGFEPGTITAHLDLIHIYENHIDGARELYLKDSRLTLPTVKTEKFNSIFDWSYQDTTLENYIHHEPMKFEVAV